MTSHDLVHIIGAGPSGLATAAELHARGVPSTILESGPQVGAAWAGRWDGLRFNTSRHNSALPGAPFPRAYGQFPDRDQYVAYLHRYASDHNLAIETGVNVVRIHPEGDIWRITTATDERRARHVIVATGALNRPRVPAWATAPSFQGEVLHSSAYRNPVPFENRTVVVVGPGSSGMEIAHELAEGGARRVLLAVRTPPNILLRESHGVPGDLLVPILMHLPPSLVDRLLSAAQRKTIGDLSAYGLPRSTEGVMTQTRTRGVAPAVVDPEVLDLIRAGGIECVPAVVALDGDGVALRDVRTVRADAVILATGYDSGLVDLFHGLEVLDERGMPRDPTGGEVAPGLRFVGFVFRPGITGYVGKIAKRVARDIAAAERRSRPHPGQVWNTTS